MNQWKYYYYWQSLNKTHSYTHKGKKTGSTPILGCVNCSLIIQKDSAPLHLIRRSHTFNLVATDSCIYCTIVHVAIYTSNPLIKAGTCLTLTAFCYSSAHMNQFCLILHVCAWRTFKHTVDNVTCYFCCQAYRGGISHMIKHSLNTQISLSQTYTNLHTLT